MFDDNWLAGASNTVGPDGTQETLGLFRVAHFNTISSPFQFHFNSDFVRGIVSMKTENSEMELNFDCEAPFHNFKKFSTSQIDYMGVN